MLLKVQEIISRLNKTEKISKNVIGLTVSNGFVLLFTFLAARVMNHALIPEQFGIFNIMNFYLLILQTITDFGLNIKGIKIINESQDKQKIVWNIVYIKITLFIITSSILLVILYLIYYVFPSEAKKLEISSIYFTKIYLLSIPAVLFMSLKSSIDILQQINNNNSSRIISEPISSIFKYIFYLFFIFISGDLVIYFIIGNTFRTFISLLLNYFLYKKNIPHHIKFDKKIVHLLLKSSLVMTLFLCFNFTVGEINHVLLEKFQNSESNLYQVGIYAPAQRILSIITTFPPIIIVPFYSEFTKLSFNSIRFIKIFKKSLIWFGFISISFTIISFLFSEFFIKLLSGNRYLESIIVLKVTSLSIIPMFFTNLFGYLILSKNKEFKYLIFTLLATVLNVLLSYILINKNFSIYIFDTFNIPNNSFALISAGILFVVYLFLMFSTGFEFILTILQSKTDKKT